MEFLLTVVQRNAIVAGVFLARPNNDQTHHPFAHGRPLPFHQIVGLNEPERVAIVLVVVEKQTTQPLVICLWREPQPKLDLVASLSKSGFFAFGVQAKAEICHLSIT